MSIKIDITIDGIEEAVRKLGMVSGALPREIGARSADEVLIPKLVRYPVASGKPQPFKTTAQRKAFFAKMRSGKIKVPYPRTGRLAMGWTYTVSDAGATAINRVRYAGMVQGDKNQRSPYFDNWPNVDQVADGSDTEIRSVAEQVCEAIITKAGLS